MREVKPEYGNGAGGNGSLSLLAACGGNSSRVWGVGRNTRRRLDEAQQNGISIALGIWLEHERKGFRYDDPQQLAHQKSLVRAAVEKYRDHPAVLLWGIGNEMEGYEQGDNPAIWKHVEDLCQMVKEIDPHHPTMSVIAEIGGDRIAAIHKFCPSLDIIGINSYGGAATLPKRYREAGGKKPFLITEFGPAGPWEVGRTNLDTVAEVPTSRKAEFYRAAFLAAKKESELCLGGYAFLWGNKLEATSTWFGMLLEGDGCRTAAVDAMTELWTGSPPKNRCPVIDSLRLDGKNEVLVGDMLEFQLAASDPENDKLSVYWSLRPEVKTYITYGDPQPSLPRLDKHIVDSSVTQARVKAPTEPGLYRVYSFVRDGNGGGAVANVSFRVSSESDAK